MVHPKEIINTFANYFSIFTGCYGEMAQQRSLDLVLQLDTFAESIYDRWVVMVPVLVEVNVAKCILVRRESEVLSVNYSSELNELLEEAKHMTIQGQEDLPQCLQELSKKSDSLWNVRARLCDLCEDYNEFRKTANSYELLLLADEVQFIEDGIEQCCTVFTWEAFDEAVMVILYDRIHTLHHRTQEIQSNVSTVVQGIEQWGQDPFYSRKDQNPKELLDLQSRQEVLRGRKMSCERSRRQLTNALEKNKQLFLVDEGHPVATDLFDQYLEFVDTEVLNSLKWTVYRNLMYLQQEIQRKGTEPLFEVRVVVKDRVIAFSPSLEDPLDMLSRKTESFIYQMEMIIGDICSMAESIPRVAKGRTRSFLDELREDDDIGDVKRVIRNCVVKGIEDMQEYVRRFDKYTFLYNNNKESIMGYAEEPKIDEFRENVRE